VTLRKGRGDLLRRPSIRYLPYRYAPHHPMGLGDRRGEGNELGGYGLAYAGPGEAAGASAILGEACSSGIRDDRALRLIATASLMRPTIWVPTRI
jgi:hypothetical protein